ncbi:hypothetical protein ACH5RR_004839 [Cinchona calisaya]|uniref:Zinc finger, CCHC-type n=1 Tax=Cinchona calisaya TaxID=153742 RepID=A0ABD3AYS8_9GENT
MATSTIKKLSTDFTKLSRFEEENFLRWQKNMKILLTTLHVAYVLTTERPKETGEETLEQTRARQKWDNDDFICMGHILNSMSGGLFDMYQDAISAKDLWERFEVRSSHQLNKKKTANSKRLKKAQLYYHKIFVAALEEVYMQSGVRLTTTH